jgi:hypothetical protein
MNEKRCGVDFGMTTILRRAIDGLLLGNEVYDEHLVETVRTAIQTVPPLQYDIT